MAYRLKEGSSVAFLEMSVVVMRVGECSIKLIIKIIYSCECGEMLHPGEDYSFGCRGSRQVTRSPFLRGILSNYSFYANLRMEEDGDLLGDDGDVKSSG